MRLLNYQKDKLFIISPSCILSSIGVWSSFLPINVPFKVGITASAAKLPLSFKVNCPVSSVGCDNFQPILLGKERGTFSPLTIRENSLWLLFCSNAAEPRTMPLSTKAENCGIMAVSCCVINVRSGRRSSTPFNVPLSALNVAAPCHNPHCPSLAMIKFFSCPVRAGKLKRKEGININEDRLV